jgi:bud emergence protein 1
MDVKAMIDGVGLPSVEEWKKEMLTYKANSIALGTLDDSSMNTNAGQDRDSARFSGSQPSSQPPSQFSSPQPSFAPPPNMASPPVPERDPYAAAQEPEPEPEPEPEYTQDAGPVILPDGVMISGNVVSFHKEMDEYWFRVHALFQPYGPEGTTDLPPARQLVLFRAYNDFYDFQVQLLEAFPREGGQDDNYPRVLPYMPGPAEEVTDQITANRQSELDEYLRLFCELRGTDQRYILEDVIVREFLAPKPGDVETEVEPASEEVYGYADSEEPDVQDMTSTMANMGVVSPAQNGEYDDEAIRTQGTTRKSHARSDSLSRRDDDTLRPAYGEQGSSSSQRNPSPIPPHMRTDAGANGHSSARGAPAQDVDPNARTSAYSRTSSAMDAPQSAGSSRSSGGRSRADAAINSPPISANNPQPAFVKIKVFDANNDLIAVRVHPRVTHAQLVEKISQRLGVPVSSLRYKDSRSEAFLGIDDDYALQDWIETTDKLVLWAE